MEIAAHRPGPSAYGGDCGFDNLTVRIQRRVVSGYVYPRRRRPKLRRSHGFCSGRATEIAAHRPGPSAYGGDFDSLTVRIQRGVGLPAEDRSFGRKIVRGFDFRCL